MLCRKAACLKQVCFSPDPWELPEQSSPLSWQHWDPNLQHATTEPTSKAHPAIGVVSLKILKTALFFIANNDIYYKSNLWEALACIHLPSRYIHFIKDRKLREFGRLALGYIAKTWWRPESESKIFQVLGSHSTQQSNSNWLLAMATGFLFIYLY